MNRSHGQHNADGIWASALIAYHRTCGTGRRARTSGRYAIGAEAHVHTSRSAALIAVHCSVCCLTLGVGFDSQPVARRGVPATAPRDAPALHLTGDHPQAGKNMGFSPATLCNIHRAQPAGSGTPLSFSRAKPITKIVRHRSPPYKISVHRVWLPPERLTVARQAVPAGAVCAPAA